MKTKVFFIPSKLWLFTFCLTVSRFRRFHRTEARLYRVMYDDKHAIFDSKKYLTAFHFVRKQH
jgi:hypothetical protein